MKVLVAGNEDGTAKELTDAFTPLGWEIIQARDAVSATAAMLRSRPDAVVLFGNLPGGGAVLVLRRLRASVHTAMTPVFAVSGRRAEDADELRTHGVDECVAPPADPVAIRAWIQSRLLSPQVVMQAPAAIIREPNRIDALTRTGLLDSPPEESFDALTRLASSLLGVPVALVSLVDSHRQFFKSQVGLGEPWATRRETPLTHSFCQWVVSEQEGLVIADARNHPVLAHNRALSDLGVVAYAGVPITATSGEPIGSLCAIDTTPREWSDAEIDLLRQLGQVAEASIAVSEAIAAERRTPPDAEKQAIERSLVLRALGVGIERCTHLLQRSDPQLTGAEQLGLVKLVEWFGRHIVRAAGT
jgi:DNA-binding response OmpR family regulator